MKCEIEFMPVGDASRAGDAIVVRYGEPDAYELMLIDGGHAGTGDALVEHLKANFSQGGRPPVIQHALITHSDGDHASGMRTVLKELPVRNLWLHIPWLLAENSRHLFRDKRFTEDGLSKKLKAEYDIIAENVDLAVKAGCQIHPPFAGATIGPFVVLSPSEYAYQHLLPQFDKTPDPDQAAIEAAGMWLGKESLIQRLIENAASAVQQWTTESWDHERLKDGGCTSASNESSVVLYGSFERGNMLLTGDAGINGLTWAADAAVRRGLPLQNFSFVQIPHHGSRRNVGPTILTRLLGPPVPQGSATRFTACVSAPKDDGQHPRLIVLNAFMRRGAKVIATQGSKICHWGGFPARDGYGEVDLMPFSSRVEEYT